MKIVKPPFTKLVAGVIKSGDPSMGVNPTVAGQAHTSQWIMDGGSDVPRTNPSAISPVTFNTNGMVDGAQTNAEATIVFDAVNVLNQDFKITVGNYELTSGNATSITTPDTTVGDFYTGGTIVQLMDTLCDTLSALPEFTATNNGVETVKITHIISLGINSDSIVISYRCPSKVVNVPISSITQFNGGSPTVGSVLIS